MSEVKMNTKAFRSAVEYVRPAIGKANTTIPSTRSIKLEKVPEGMGVSANNLTIGIRVNVLTEFNGDAPVGISAERAVNYLKLLDTDDLAITFKSGRAHFRSGSCRAQVPTVENLPEFQMPTSGTTLGLEQAVLLRALKYVAIAISDEESRYVLNAAYIIASNGVLEVVATDGHRISVYSIKLKGLVDCQMLLPSELCDALLSTLRDSDATVTLQMDDKMIGVRMEGPSKEIIEIRSARIAGQFPNYKAVLPVEARNQIDVEAHRLLLGIQRAISMAPTDSQAIKFTFDASSITVRGADSQAGESEESIGLDKGLEQEVVIGFRGSYLTDALKKIRGNVKIDIGTPSQVMMLYAEPFDGEELRYGVMPMKM